MSKRLALAFAVLLGAAVAALGCAAVASADSGGPAQLADDVPTPLSPDDASSMIGAAGTSGVSATSVVTPSAALAAASAPGAVTEYASDLTLNQAVGLDPTVGTAAAQGGAAPAGAASTTCWSSAAWAQWGTWPYEQKLTDTTYWCAVYGVKITYRSSSVTGSGTLCGLSWRASQLIAGGIGFHYFTIRSSGGFSCPTAVPWIVLHPSHYLEVRRTDVGTGSVPASG